MARVELSAAAVEDLQALIARHELPGDTPARVAHSLRALERFPDMGVAPAGRWSGMCFLLGPWRWMLLVYVVVDDGARVVVVLPSRASAWSARCGGSAGGGTQRRQRDRRGGARGRRLRNGTSG